MICPSCNTGNRDDAKFCKGCGRSLAHAQVATTTENAPANAQEQPVAEPVVEAGASAQGADTLNHVPSGEPQDDNEDATLVISPEKMMAYHQRRLKDASEPQEAPAAAEPAQQEEDRNQRNGQGFPLPVPASMGGHEGDTSVPSPHDSTMAEAEQYTIAPAFSLPTRDEHGAIPIPPPPPPESLEAAGEPKTEETPGEEMQHNGYDANAGYPEMEMSNTMQDSFEHESFEHEFVEQAGQTEPSNESQRSEE